ncbi:MAG TPA: alpha-hydroxy acid oxidase [Bryobacteraceae bacterium]|nr:alpha-hydroxy acid oxidase [Bryobacteraceae bacterium]
MSLRESLVHSRRKFLSYLAGSPLLLGQQISDVITDASEALNVFDFEAAARRVLPAAHFGYMATGVEDDLTLKANREGFSRIYLRPRRLIDITRADMKTEIFGTTWDSPIGLAPVGNAKAFHPEGEIPTTRAAKVKKSLQILSTATNSSFEDVSQVLGRPPWYQLYVTSRFDFTERLVKRVEAAGCQIIAITVDTQAGRRTETFERSRRLDKRECVTCHGSTREDFYRRKPMFQGLDVTGLATQNPGLTWDHLQRIKKMTSMKVVLKGIETAEDTKLCIESGIDGVIVSNHGGRAGESGRGTIECLPEVVEAAGSKIPVMIDGGFRRGTDIFKALALGATGVCIGRPYIWALSAFGQAGVERVIDMLRLELELVMKQCGARSISEITRASVGFRDQRL